MILACSLAAALLWAPTSNGEDAAPRPILDFAQAGSGTGWAAVNDGVMGGLSKGGPEIRDGLLHFSGDLSLENNGGFSSIRKDMDLNLTGFAGVRLRIRGDGRTYQIRFQTGARYQQWPVSYSGDFQTTAGQWIEVEVPFTGLEQSFRGRKLTEYPFDPAAIELVGLLIADKQPGPFFIAVQWIQAYR